VGIELRWEGSGENEKGICVKDESLSLNSQLSTLNSLEGKTLVEVDPRFFRPAEVEQLLGDPTKAKTLLGWNPRKTSFEDLVKIMVEYDMRFVKKLYLKAHLED
jgi:GDPmannose 4,6-dehydratase